MHLTTLFQTCLGLLPLLLGASPAASPETPAPYVVFLGTLAADIQRPQTDPCDNCTYDLLAPRLAAEDIVVAYDGLRVDL